MGPLWLFLLCLVVRPHCFACSGVTAPPPPKQPQNPVLIEPATSVPGTKGDSYVIRFTNVKDGQVMTVDGDMPVPGVNITARTWNRSESQKWTIIRRGDVYLILPQRQHKEWSNFLKRTMDQGRDNLPAVTVVVGIDVQNGRITQQVLHGRSNQHWEFRDAKEGRILIASPAREKCIQAKHPAKQTPSFFQRAKERIQGVFSGGERKTEEVLEPRELVAADCDETDVGQLWRLESISY